MVQRRQAQAWPAELLWVQTSPTDSLNLLVQAGKCEDIGTNTENGANIQDGTKRGSCANTEKGISAEGSPNPPLASSSTHVDNDAFIQLPQQATGHLVWPTEPYAGASASVKHDLLLVHLYPAVQRLQPVLVDSIMQRLAQLGIPELTTLRHSYAALAQMSDSLATSEFVAMERRLRLRAAQDGIPR